jgi:protein-S-isoprenylcysteine O-methyltransferase Ste14
MSQHVKIPLPPLILLISIALVVAANRLVPLAQLIPAPYTRAGFFVIGLGLFLIAWQLKVMKEHHTTIKYGDVPTTLVTTGPFRFSRNPGYLGQSLITLGVAFWLGSLGALLIPVIEILLLDRMIISPEEQILEKIFGSQYLDYKEQVRRWI